MSDTVLYSEADGIGTITFNRPQVFNAMSGELMIAFRDLTARLKTSATLRALIIKGNGKAFLAGGDVAMFNANKDDPQFVHTVSELIDVLHASISNLRALPFPVIAEVHGACAGAGMSLMAACDFAIAATGTQFKTAYSMIGLTPDGGSTFFLPRMVGMRKATELIMLSESISAEDALNMGLVNRVVALAVLHAEVEALAARLAAGPTGTYAGTKALLNQAMSNTLSLQLQAEKESFVACTKTADFNEGVGAFVEKRAAKFSGK